ncbi:phytanoyl-CoA dioxygenase family protein [Candidatus Poribacteria bacterium]|nr:phytanoyl-CoA dioxygenase family protein [Candidatus Poribacteria bacterium]
MRLTQEQCETFRTQGVLIVKNALTDADLQPVIDEISDWISERALALKEEGKIEDLHEDEPFDKRFAKLLAQSGEMAGGLDIMNYRGKAIFEFLKNDNLLDVVEGIVGPEITCNPIQHLRAKPPVIDGNASWAGGVPWHQDAGVMMPEAEGSEIVTCWLPLGDSTIEMGCLQALPGVTEEEGYLVHQKEGGTMIKPELMPDVEPLMLECYRGDVVLLSRFTPHRSEPNTSDRCRWSLDLRYQTTGHHTGRTAHPDFIVRSRKNPENVLSEHQAWCDLWVDAFENPRGFAGHRSV